MRRKLLPAALAAAVAAPVLWAGTTPAVAQPTPAAPHKVAESDDLPAPLEVKRRALRQEAMEQVLSGAARVEQRGQSRVVTLGSSAHGAGAEYVELSRASDKVFVVLAEFGDERHPDFPDQDTDPDTPGPTRFDGPRHNEIPEPDRRTDNSTIWRSDFSRDYFQRLYFSPDERDDSLRTYFESQSSGQYTIDGTVTDWVRVRYNAARYGRSNGEPCGGLVCTNVFHLVADSVNEWVRTQREAGKSPEQIESELAEFDV